MKPVLIINDIAGRGKVAGVINQVVVSCAGYDTAFLPTVLLSDRTGRGEVIREVVTDFNVTTLRMWQNSQDVFSGILVGYCADVEQLKYIVEEVSWLKVQGPIVLDPIMGDNGELYQGFTDDYVQQMRQACATAEVILPNLTEACLLGNIPYRKEVDMRFLVRLCRALKDLGPRNVVITGIEMADKIGCYDDQEGIHWVARQEGHYVGTGDLFASCFAIRYMRGDTISNAVQWAQKIVVAAIQDTQQSPYPSGNLKFENQLMTIIKESGKNK